MTSSEKNLLERGLIVRGGVTFSPKICNEAIKKFLGNIGIHQCDQIGRNFAVCLLYT